MATDVNRLREDTLAYWDNPNSDKLERIYIPDLLLREIDFARARNAIQKIDCDILVLLVGHSIEPLLQSVCAFQPNDQIFLVLNREYDTEGGVKPGLVFGNLVKELIRKIPKNLVNGIVFTENMIIGKETEDQPSAVFRLLQQNITTYLKNQKKFVIDITGAKKSMVAGAFMFAAYTAVPISYVDFDQYDPRQSKPFGYTCRIGLLKDPYEAFRLRDWERVRRLYENYQFRAAREILGSPDPEDWEHVGLIRWMRQESGGGRYCTPDQVRAVKRLAAVLELYELWDNGDFSRALEKSHILLSKGELKGEPFDMPLAVRELGPFWPRFDSKHDPHKAARELLNALKEIEVGEKALPATPRTFVIYARDEVAKIDRLIRFNEDYRSALLRAVGLGESLLKARWVRLWFTDRVEIASEKDGDYRLMKDALPTIQDRAKELEKEILGAYQAIQLIPGLRYSKKDSMKYRGYYSIFGCKRQPDGSLKDCLYLRRHEASAPRLQDKLLFHQIKDLRDKAIHTYLSVSEGIAEEALRITRASLDDYEENWATDPDRSQAENAGTQKDYQSLSWEHLCTLCGIDFLPPAPAGKEAL